MKMGELISPKGGALKRLLIGFCCSPALLSVPPKTSFFSIYFHFVSIVNNLPLSHTLFHYLIMGWVIRQRSQVLKG